MTDLKVDLNDLVRGSYADSNYLISPTARERLLRQAYRLHSLAQSCINILHEGANQAGATFDSPTHHDWMRSIEYVEAFAEANDIPLIRKSLST